MHHPRGRSGLRAPNEGIQHGSNSNRVISFSVDVLFVIGMTIRLSQLISTAQLFRYPFG
jgi:tetrahydromethanopterin S-methyltransferase subunit F